MWNSLPERGGLTPSRHWVVAEASGSHLRMSASTLVETVSLNYEDFNESFLTCATCLCQFDTYQHRAKLLSCSHSVCGICLERLAALPHNQDGHIRCPICRETIPIPTGGVRCFPPSFLVNQLIDLMQRQRRDVVPKCSSHPAEELLFCETCDTVFCPSCSFPGNVNSGCHNHTIVPFSIAIKRMSEILLYKANQCIKNLDRAASNVQAEMEGLDSNVDRIMDEMNNSFNELAQLLEKRKRSLVDEVRKVRDEKRRVLQDQLGIIQTEKAKVEQECDGLEYQVEVRNITQKISDLNQKLDTTLTLIEPRENSFVRYESSASGGDVLKGLQGALSQFGSLSVSRTFPPLCTAVAQPAAVHTLSRVLLNTIDYTGKRRTSGGDPIEVALLAWGENSENESRPTPIPVLVVDNADGSYALQYAAPVSGEYRMEIKIFNRPIKSSPVLLQVSPHHNPVWEFGSHGSDVYHLHQPVRVRTGPIGQIFILDTGNNRLKVITCDGSVIKHISGEPMMQQSAVGLALLGEVGFLTLNWRTRAVTEWSLDTGRETRTFSFSEFLEPIDLAVDSRGRILVADNGARKVFIFDSNAIPVLSFPVKRESSATMSLPRGLSAVQSTTTSKYSTISHSASLKPAQPTAIPAQNVTCVGVGMNDDILVGGSSGVQIYDSGGNFIRHVPVAPLNKEGKSGAGLLIGGVAFDPASNYILTTVIEKNRSFLAVSTYKGEFKFAMDSHASKLKRPSGLCVFDDAHCLVADLGNHCIKKFRFK